MTQAANTYGANGDLPSGMPANAPGGAGGGGTSGPTDNSKSKMENAGAPPLAVIFEKPVRPFPVIIKGFGFDTLSTYLTGYEMGMYRFIVRIWDLMRKRDEHLLSVSGKRIKRTSRLDWEIQPNDSDPKSLAQAEFLNDFMTGLKYKLSGNAKQTFGISKALRHLMTALANGYAACEIEWLPGGGAAGGDGSIRANLIRIRSDYFDETSGEMQLYPDGASITALEVPDNKLIIHRADEALMIASSILFVMKQISLGQWNDFCDRFGLPGLLGEAPDGASQASKDELLKLLVNWSSKLAAVLPPGYKATFANAAAGLSGGIPAEALVDRCEDAMSVLWLGGNLSTKSQSGSGTLAGGAQREQEIELTADDAADLAETITAQICAPAVQFQFGQPLRCAFIFKIAQTIDLAASIGVDVALVTDLGLKISEADLRAKYGWRKPDEDEDVIEPKPQPAGGAANQVPLPKAPSLRSEESGTAGTALKSGHVAGGGGRAAHQSDAVVAEHLAAGRRAMAPMFEAIQAAIGDVSQLSAKELETRLKNLQGKLPAEDYQNVILAVIEQAFNDGSKQAMAHMAGGVG